MTKHRPFFSVVIPLYNREKLFADTIKSISSQTCSDFEVIVVDDGSTDNSAIVAREYIEKLELDGQVVTIENSGHGAARDHGIQLSSGKYIAPIDSDDLWMPDYLSTVKRAIAGSKYAEESLIFADFAQFFDNGEQDLQKSKTLTLLDHLTKKEVEKNIFKIEDGLFEYLIYEQPIFWGAVAFSRQVYNNVGPIGMHLPGRSGSPVEWEFFLRAALKGIKGIYIGESNTKIRRHEGNMSSELITQLEGEVEILSFVLNHYSLNESHRSLVKAEYKKRGFACAYQYFSIYEMKNCRKLFLKLGWKHDKLKSILYLCASFLPIKIIRLLRQE